MLSLINRITAAVAIGLALSTAWYYLRTQSLTDETNRLEAQVHQLQETVRIRTFETKQKTRFETLKKEAHDDPIPDSVGTHTLQL